MTNSTEQNEPDEPESDGQSGEELRQQLLALLAKWPPELKAQLKVAERRTPPQQQ
jgi:hypothetical protein